MVFRRSADLDVSDFGRRRRLGRLHVRRRRTRWRLMSQRRRKIRPSGQMRSSDQMAYPGIHGLIALRYSEARALFLATSASSPSSPGQQMAEGIFDVDATVRRCGGGPRRSSVRDWRIRWHFTAQHGREIRSQSQPVDAGRADGNEEEAFR